MKKFQFMNYENCCFKIEHYCNNSKAIAITVIDSETDNELAMLTVLDEDFDYEVEIATIANDDFYGDDINGYKSAREILTELGIIRKVWETYITGEYISADVCTIDLYTLKEFSKIWDYWEFREEN